MVGVGTNPGQVTLSGPDLVCYSGSTFTANNPPTGSTINWTVTPYLLEVYSGGSTATPTIRATSTTTNGSGTISVNFTSNGYTTYGPTKEVCLGTPVINAGEIIFSNSAEGQGYLCTNQAGNTFELTSCNSDSYEIKLTYLDETTLIAQYNTYTGTGSLDYSQLYPGYYLFWVRGTNNCGTGEWCATEVEYVDCSLFRLLISPNPATSETTIELTNTAEAKETAQIPEWELEVYGTNQELKIKTPNLKDKTYKLNTQGWKNGVYIVRAKIGEEMISGKLVVKY